MYLCTLLSQCSTYHSNGKVVVYNAVRHWVPSLFLVCGCDINLPAIQHHLCTVLNVPQDLKEAFALIASGRIRWDKWDVKMGLEYLVPHDWHFANTGAWANTRKYKWVSKYFFIHAYGQFTYSITQFCYLY